MDPDAKTRCQNRMARVDAMMPELRALVNEHGLTIINAYLDCGCREPNVIAVSIASIRAGENRTPGVHKPHQRKHLINTVLEGSVEIGKRSDKNQMPHGWRVRPPTEAAGTKAPEQDGETKSLKGNT